MARTSPKSILHETWTTQLQTLRPYLISQDAYVVSEKTGYDLTRVRNAIYYVSGQEILPKVIKELTEIVQARIQLTESSQKQINQFENKAK